MYLLFLDIIFSLFKEIQVLNSCLSPMNCESLSEVASLRTNFFVSKGQTTWVWGN